MAVKRRASFARAGGHASGGSAGVGGQKLRELDLALELRTVLVALGVAQTKLGLLEPRVGLGAVDAAGPRTLRWRAPCNARPSPRRSLRRPRSGPSASRSRRSRSPRVGAWRAAANGPAARRSRPRRPAPPPSRRRRKRSAAPARRARTAGCRPWPFLGLTGFARRPRRPSASPCPPPPRWGRPCRTLPRAGRRRRRRRSP